MPSDDIHIHTALISVYHKDETLERIIAILADKGVRLLSTGGTRAWIQQCGHRCDAVEDVTGYPSILGGRVKTLHPGIFGGILSRRNNTQDSDECARYGIEPIDMVIVDLYPLPRQWRKAHRKRTLSKNRHRRNLAYTRRRQKLPRCGHRFIARPIRIYSGRVCTARCRHHVRHTPSSGA